MQAVGCGSGVVTRFNPSKRWCPVWTDRPTSCGSCSLLFTTQVNVLGQERKSGGLITVSLSGRDIKYDNGRSAMQDTFSRPGQWGGGSGTGETFHSCFGGSKQNC